MRERGTKVWRRLRLVLRLVWAAHAPATLAILLGTMCLGAAPVVVAWLTKVLVDMLVQPAEADAGLAAGIVAGLVIATLVSQYGQDVLRYLEGQLGRRVNYLTQDRVFAKINSFIGLTWVERPRFHDQIRLAQQTGHTGPQLVTLTAASTQQTVTIVGFAGTLLATSPVLGLVMLSAAVPQLVAHLRLARQRVTLLRELSPYERRQHFYSNLQADPRAAKELRLFGLGGLFHRRMLEELANAQLGEQRLDRRELRVSSLLNALTAAVSALALGLVAHAAVQRRISPGDVTLFLAALAAITHGVAQLVGRIAQASETIGIIGYYEELMATPPDDTAPPLPRDGAMPVRAAPRLRDGVVFEDVWFRYADDLPWVLQGVDLALPASHSIGLVGRNGAGKSTVVKLIGRLYEPTRGRILWDGVDLRELDHDSLRDRIGMVFQDYMTYDLTAQENIGLGDLARMDDLAGIQRAAELAGVAEAIGRLPSGYATMLSRMHVVGEDEDERTGVLLSGGQWQRLALARMLMRADRDMLVLDEPSAGLDAEAEHDLNRVVHTQTAGRTRLLISHRLNSVRMADRILVLDDGRIEEEGDHEELMRLGGRYAGLFSLQAKGYEDRISSPE